MSKKLDSVKRSLFKEFSADDDDAELKKLCNDTQKTSRTSIKVNNTVIAAAVVLTVVVAGLSKFATLLSVTQSIANNHAHSQSHTRKH